MHNRQILLKALQTSFSISLAYLPLGLLFGLVLENQGYYWLLAPLMSLLVYAGAVQFLALSCLEQGTGIVPMLLACFFIAIRNSFYGPSFFSRFHNFSVLSRCYLVYGLVDATYALLLRESPVAKEDDEKYCVFLTALIQVYWIVGTIIGALAGRALPEIKGLDFVLTVLFTTLAIEQFYKIKKLWPFVVGICGWCIMQIIMPKYALLGAIGFSAIIFLLVPYDANKPRE